VYRAWRGADMGRDRHRLSLAGVRRAQTLQRHARSGVLRQGAGLGVPDLGAGRQRGPHGCAGRAGTRCSARPRLAAGWRAGSGKCDAGPYEYRGHPTPVDGGRKLMDGFNLAVVDAGMGQIVGPPATRRARQSRLTGQSRTGRCSCKRWPRGASCATGRTSHDEARRARGQGDAGGGARVAGGAGECAGGGRRAGGVAGELPRAIWTQR